LTKQYLAGSLPFNRSPLVIDNNNMKLQRRLCREAKVPVSQKESRAFLLSALSFHLDLDAPEGFSRRRTQEAQLLNCLKATGMRVGSLTNFKHPRAEIKRMVFGLPERHNT
jgi:hypothetical protein